MQSSHQPRQVQSATATEMISAVGSELRLRERGRFGDGRADLLGFTILYAVVTLPTFRAEPGSRK